MNDSDNEFGAVNYSHSAPMKQANVISSAGGERTTRQRASVACASCRDRRIRCVVPEGQQECTQCERAGTTCIIRNDDERRRPISKAYTSSLTSRIAMLESMLQEKGTSVPPANHPPKTRAERAATSTQIPESTNSLSDRERANTDQENQSSPDSAIDGFAISNHEDENVRMLDESDLKETAVVRQSLTNKDNLVHKLLSTRGHLSFDQLSGRLRFFGPTTNCHIYADNTDAQAEVPSNREPLEQVRRTQRIIRSLSIATHDYLMGLFWENYNSVIHIVHEEAFNEDKENSQNKFYSGFLHIAILAMGYRFADLDRDDMKKITLGDRECTLHREAKYMLDVELERPGGIPSVQAFLLLGDLECGVGRDNTGWMYAGMANRLSFDIGLHLDCKNDGLSEKEVQIRHMTLLACVVYDKYWALFLGRPTGIKTTDLEMYYLSKQFASLGSCKPAGPGRSLETRIYEELADLMELAGKIAEIRDNGKGVANGAVPSAYDDDNAAYLHVMDLDRQLQGWYRRLPEEIVWKPSNINTAPFSFFLLHQQYHCSLILLHRPWARYLDSSPEADNSGSESNTTSNRNDLNNDIETPMHAPMSTLSDSHSAMSRAICTRQAIRIARIFWHHRQRFSTRKIFVTGIQHAGTAATALVAALASTTDIVQRRNNIQYLECLTQALADMSVTYQPAQSMSTVLLAIMGELRQEGRKLTPPRSVRLGGGSPAAMFCEGVAIPARRESNSNDIEERSTFKKRLATKTVRASSFRSEKASNRMRAGSMAASSSNTTVNSTRAPSIFSASIETSNSHDNDQSHDSDLDLHDTHSLNSNIDSHNKLTRDSGAGEGYVMITPRSETSLSNAWPNLNSDHNALDFPMATFGMNMNSEGLWMGVDDGLGAHHDDPGGLGHELSAGLGVGMGSPFSVRDDLNERISGNVLGDLKSPNLDFFSFT